MSDLTLAVDIGGTKFAAGLVEPDGRVVAAERVATPRGGDAETLWETLTGLLDRLEPPPGVAGVGIGCGGPMTWPAGEVSPLNMGGWRGFPLRERLAARFPGIPVRIHNDAICLAVAEHWRGAGRGSAAMLGMVVSTGVGGGLILGGRIVDGGTGNAGHVGHVVVDPGGPPCGCGGNGCLEAVARGPGLAAWALAQGWSPGGAGSPGRTGSPGRARSPEDPGGEPSGQDGELYREEGTATARRLAADAAAGDPIALAAMTRAGRALGIAIASAVNLCDLDLVTIGGGLSQAGGLLFGPLEEALREHTRMGFAQRVRVVPAALGQDAGLVGAAALVIAGDRYWSPGP
ncbi:ROK family protein [Microbispora cellulosiformans]|uniref:ROK family protein n=1 Tax=Microbispora cellulosiformans TaxID=2614688 RepID=A0A5J5JVN9_9ACTN|nr:ROK family protein [Microbispora cellulosiformans]KAA9375292.1 ROK family protein [Microbispora cellulosiformans]